MVVNVVLIPPLCYRGRLKSTDVDFKKQKESGALDVFPIMYFFRLKEAN